MGDTFRRADGVLTCIGMHDDSSRVAVTKLREFGDFLAKRNTSVFVLTDNKIFDRGNFSDLLFLGELYEGILFDRQGDGTEGSASKIERLSRKDALTLRETRQCQDRRVIIYGKLSFVDWTALGIAMPDGTWITGEDDNMTIAPDYTRSRYDLAKLISPRPQDIESMLHLCDALHLRSEDAEVADGIAKRKERGSSPTWSLQS